MTLEFNIDDHNNMLIAFITGEYEFDKIVKVLNLTLEKCIEKKLPRALVDMAQIVNTDVTAVIKYVSSHEMISQWKDKVRLCIVYDHKYLPDIQKEDKQDYGDWVLVTPNKNQSVFWLLKLNP